MDVAATTNNSALRLGSTEAWFFMPIGYKWILTVAYVVIIFFYNKRKMLDAIFYGS
jgi:hypothetical protein